MPYATKDKKRELRERVFLVLTDEEVNQYAS
jgi:hypothetical protein